MSSGIVLDMSMEDSGLAPGDDLVASVMNSSRSASAAAPGDDLAGSNVIRSVARQTTPAGFSAGSSDHMTTNTRVAGGDGAFRNSAPPSTSVSPPSSSLPTTGVRRHTEHSGDASTQRPGAYAATGRPVGELPAWQRPRNRNRFSLMGNRRNRDSQAHLPPEMREVRPSPLARIQNSVMNLFTMHPHTDDENLHRTPSSRRIARQRERQRQRRSSIAQRISLAFAGDAHVTTPEQIREETDEKEFKKEFLAVVCGVIVVVVVAVVVAVVVISGGGDKEDSDDPSPTKAPTVAAAPGESQRFTSLRTALEDLFIDYTLLEDPSTPEYKALTWLADLDEAEIHKYDLERLGARYALATLFYATNGDDWLKNFGFLSPEHECDWGVEGETRTDLPGLRRGITCNNDGKVISIILDGNNLSGSIPPDLSILSDLQYLSAASNTSGGKAGLDAIKSMRNIGKYFGSLTFLDLSDNKFDSFLPSELGRLSNLEILHLEENNLKFTIPTQLGGLSNLKELFVQNNGLQGYVETPFRNLQNLKVLRAENNHLLITPEWSFPTSLNELNLGGNVPENPYTDSPLSSNIGRLSNLHALILREMGLVGELPTELGLITALRMLRVQKNSLSGAIPWDYLNGSSLEVLDATRCNLPGQLPSDLGRFSNLVSLKLSANGIVGSIPESIGNLTALEEIDVSTNSLEGTIPSTVGEMESLQRFYVQFNFLTGVLPTEMENMISLRDLGLFGNEFSGGDIEFICDQNGGPAVRQIDGEAGITCSCCTVV